jgi:hypothetical protein
MARSNFDLTGFQFGDSSLNITRLYGLSDFWQLMFEDSSNIDLLLEATSHQCSDIYSKFLQLTSTLTLADIQTTIGYQAKLILISSKDAVVGEVNTYKLPETILDSRFIANRPFLPTTTLEKDVHYSIVDNNTNIRFYSDISLLGFPVRAVSDGSRQYALWVIDAEVDEQIITKYFADLIQVSPEASTDAFKSFVTGLFYLYTNGPNLALMRKGLNLALGIPLARGHETVLDIRQYLDTHQWLVTTDQNSYMVPYGLSPSVTLGQVLNTSDEIAQWVQVKDYISDGDWWINLQIPPSVIPYLPDGQTNRKAIAGSYVDQAMSSFLKNNTFLVNVNVTTFKDIQYFEQLFSIIKRAKPAYTIPIYIWSVPIPTEILQVGDDTLSYDRNVFLWENATANTNEFTRNSSYPFLRSSPVFIRCSLPYSVGELSGLNAGINGPARTFDGGNLTGFINFPLQYRNNTSSEQGWMRALHVRGGDVQPLRSQMAFTRGIPQANDGVGMRSFFDAAAPQLRTVPLYTTLDADLKAKFSALNIAWPGGSSFTMFKPGTNEGPNGTVQASFLSVMQANLTSLFTRGASYTYLGRFMPIEAYRTFTPQSGDLGAGDYMFFTQIQDNTWAAYWVTSNTSTGPFGFVFGDSEALTMSVTTRTQRGFGPWGTPWYTVRGAGGAVNYTRGTDASGINRGVINGTDTTDMNVSVSYSDSNNSAQTSNRGGITILMTKEST